MDADTTHLQLARRLVASRAARAVREAAGLSRPEMARGSGFTYGALRAWEAGVRRPTGRAGVAYGRLLHELTGGHS